MAFLPLLEAAGKKDGRMSPSVIVISSMSGIMRHAQGHFSYNAAKGATVHLTKLMSAEFMKIGIRVNSIAPGYFPSEMTTKESGADQKSALPDSQVQEKGHVPMQRAGADEEMAQAAVRTTCTWEGYDAQLTNHSSQLFLHKNQYVNGEVLAVDGGVLNVVAGR